MKSKRALLNITVAMIFAIAAGSAYADSISSTTPGAGWVSGWSTGETGTTFFNHTSWDGSQKNIGYCLTGTGGCTQLNPSAPGALSYYGVGSQAPSNIMFTNTGNPVATATLRIEIAGYSGTNIFGWYDADQAGSPTLHTIFNGAASGGNPGTSVTFTPTMHYGFYIQVNGGSTVYYMNSAKNTSDIGYQHFATFLGTPADTYWLGIEDLAVGPNNTGDRDFNDMVIKVTSSPVPEPASLALFGSGLLTAAGFVRKKLRK